LKQAAEQAKMELSSLSATNIMLPFIAVKGAEPLSLELELTRARLEELIGAMIRSTLEPVESALRGANPDEAIALGAAVQAGLKSGAISTERGIMITDVCPFTLGVEVVANTGSHHGTKMGGMFSPIIPRNSTVPVSRTEVYSTTGDQQRIVDIKVYQGESRLVKNNTFLDSYSIDGIPPAPAGHEKVAITFTYDVNGILNCKTKIVSTGKEAMLVVDKSAQRMSEGDKGRAKERLDGEWKGEPKPAGGAMGGAGPSGAPSTGAPSSG